MGIKGPGAGSQTTKNVNKPSGLDSSQTMLLNNYYQSLQSKNSTSANSKDKKQETSGV